MKEQFDIHKAYDTLLLDVIEERGIQLWPNRNSKGTAIVSWTVSSSKPWVQTTKQSLKAALVKHLFKLHELQFVKTTALPSATPSDGTVCSVSKQESHQISLCSLCSQTLKTGMEETTK